jgi:hypothetical protein
MAPNVMSRLARSGRHVGLTWRYLFNLSPTLAYKFNGVHPSGEAARVLNELNRDGVAVTSADKLLGPSSSYDELKTAIDKLELEQAPQLAEARRQADEPDTIGDKTFVLQLLGENPLFEPESIYARFALQPPILQLANAYFGMYTRLRFYNVWHTLTTRTDARESQLWHRDREDHRILKMFVYFSDVDEGAGPFTYAAGTHRKRLQREPAYHLEGHVQRTRDEQMAEVLGPERWIKTVGPRGTIVFADTRGFHKGGLARDHDRLMYVCMFTSQASQSKELMRRTQLPSLPREKDLAFALMSPRGDN